MNDNWPLATEEVLIDANKSILALIDMHAAGAIPGLIGALVRWAVLNDHAPQMERGFIAAAELLPSAAAAWARKD